MVITRNPAEYNRDKPQFIIEKKQRFHEELKNKGILIKYDPRIHAKLLVFDGQIAIISSMNYYSFSSGGSSWEANMISIDDAIVNSVHMTIQQLLKKF